MSGNMMIDQTALPDVLPTARLHATGKPLGDLRIELRQISNWRNVGTVVMVWGWVVAIAAAARLIDTWWSWAMAFVFMAPMHARFLILMHEAAHKLLFSNKRANDLVGTWLIGYPAFSPIGIYRRSHFAHHREEFGPEEPDIPFYSGYRTSPHVMRRRLFRDAVGISGWKNLKPLFRGLKSPVARPAAIGILGSQIPLIGLYWVATGRWYAYIVLWFAPYMTGWRVINRLRAIAEHGGLGASSDRRQTTHHVRQSWLACFWMVPFHTGWHLAHHVDMGIPWRNLPAFHLELVAAGYVTPTITYPSYIALWKALASEGKPSTWRPVPTIHGVSDSLTTV
jgi:fatty acid desaturase